MAVGDAVAGLRDLRGALRACKDETLEVVRIICYWAADAPLEVMARIPGLLETQAPGYHPAEDTHGRHIRQSFALLLLREVPSNTAMLFRDCFLLKFVLW